MPTTLERLVALLQAEAPSWQPGQGVDRLTAGEDPGAIDRLAVTMMATPAVIAQAAELGVRLIITHEPLYHDHLDQPQDPQDPVLRAKQALLERHGVAVWRCHDAIHRLHPDGILAGMVAALGWGERQRDPLAPVFAAPAPTLGELAAQIGRSLEIDGIRVVGDPELPLQDVAVSCGAAGFARHRHLLRQPGVNVLVCGEQREWETCEYVRDSNQLGRPCGLLVLGHVNSEEAGMRWLADWLAARLSGVAVHWLRAGDPFWHR